LQRVVETTVLAHHRRDQSGDGLFIGNIDRLTGCVSRAREFLEGGCRRRFAAAGDDDAHALTGTITSLGGHKHGL
jgi:hypothetical protein